jgi:hypothetical protein
VIELPVRLVRVAVPAVDAPQKKEFPKVSTRSLLLNLSHHATLERLLVALMASGATIENRKPVHNHSGVVVWILEQIENELEKNPQFLTAQICENPAPKKFDRLGRKLADHSWKKPKPILYS